MTRKRLFIISAALIIIIIIGWTFWYFVLKKGNIPIPISSIDFTTPEKKIKNSNVKNIGEKLVISPHQNSKGEIVFYDFSGQLWRLNNDDSKPILIDQSPIKNIAEVIWSTNTKNIVKSGTNQSDILYTISDPDQKSLSNLKAETESAAFAPDGKKIVYQARQNSTVNNLFISDSNGKNQKILIKDFKLRDVILNWRNANNIAIISKPSSIVEGNLWFLDIRNLNITKIIDGLFGLEILFAPDGKIFIYSYVDQNDKNPVLAVYDKNGNKKIINNISTLSDKCVWAKDSVNIYCAVPESWPDSAFLPDDYYKNAFLTNDNLWRINTETGEKMLISEHIGDISNLVLNKEENGIFFIAKENQSLYRLDSTKE